LSDLAAEVVAPAHGQEMELLQSLKRRERHLGAGDTWEGGCARGLMPEVSRGQPLHAANPLT
jgi:hypothetical protein